MLLQLLTPKLKLALGEASSHTSSRQASSHIEHNLLVEVARELLILEALHSLPESDKTTDMYASTLNNCLLRLVGMLPRYVGNGGCIEGTAAITH